MQRKQAELLTLASVAASPEAVTTEFSLRTGEAVVFRPLATDDEVGLATFLESLSPQTRRFCTYSATAREMCEAINRYDKLRMVAVVDHQVIALFEFSLCITESDITRYSGYGIELDERTDVRFGPCIVDVYQNQGLGSELLPLVIDIARRFGKERMILWGGVFADNHRAIRYYEKNGFRIVGEYRDDANEASYDAIMVLP